MKTLEVVAAIIVKDHELFACQRGEHRYIGYKFEFPGGKVEINEDHETALKREIMEELNTKIEVERFFFTITHEYPTFIVNLHTYVCHVVEGTLDLLEHHSSRWLTKENLFSVDWAEADFPILQKIIAEQVI